MQTTRFGLPPKRREQPRPSPAPMLPFTSYTSDGRRGEMPAWWVDSVLIDLREAGSPVPTLTELQAAYDLGLTSGQASDRIVHFAR